MQQIGAPHPVPPQPKHMSHLQEEKILSVNCGYVGRGASPTEPLVTKGLASIGPCALGMQHLLLNSEERPILAAVSRSGAKNTPNHP